MNSKFAKKIYAKNKRISAFSPGVNLACVAHFVGRI